MTWLWKVSILRNSDRALHKKRKCRKGIKVNGIRFHKGMIEYCWVPNKFCMAIFQILKAELQKHI